MFIRHSRKRSLCIKYRAVDMNENQLSVLGSPFSGSERICR